MSDEQRQILKVEIDHLGDLIGAQLALNEHLVCSLENDQVVDANNTYWLLRCVSDQMAASQQKIYSLIK